MVTFSLLILTAFVVTSAVWGVPLTVMVMLPVPAFTSSLKGYFQLCVLGYCGCLVSRREAGDNGSRVVDGRRGVNGSKRPGRGGKAGKVVACLVFEGTCGDGTERAVQREGLGKVDGGLLPATLTALVVTFTVWVKPVPLIVMLPVPC
jgi:hypothetical protein